VKNARIDGLARLLGCALLLVALAGCGEETKEKMKDAGRSIGEKAGHAWSEVREFASDKKDQALALFAESKDALAAQFEKARAKSKDWGTDARGALESKWQAVQETYAKAKDAGAEGWGAARDAFVAAYEAFQAELAKHSK
jgi:hypothetical protein